MSKHKFCVIDENGVRNVNYLEPRTPVEFFLDFSKILPSYVYVDYLPFDHRISYIPTISIA